MDNFNPGQYSKPPEIPCETHAARTTEHEQQY